MPDAKTPKAAASEPFVIHTQTQPDPNNADTYVIRGTVDGEERIAVGEKAYYDSLLSPQAKFMYISRLLVEAPPVPAEEA